MKSTFGKLTSGDFWKGLLLAVGVPVLLFIQQAIPGWTQALTDLFNNATLAALIQVGLSALVTYLLKNLGTDDTAHAVKTIEKQGGVVKDSNGNRVTLADPNPPIRMRMLIPLIGLLAITSCKSLSPVADANQKAKIENIATHVDDLYKTMLSSGDMKYGTYKAEYQHITEDMQLLYSNDQKRLQPAIILDQDKRIIDMWQKRKMAHETKGVLNVGQVNSNRAYMKSIIDPRIISEKQFK